MRIIILLLFLSLSIRVSAQRTVVGLPKMNMLYVGLENPIEVAVDGVKAKDIVVEMKGGELKGENGKYVFVPDFKQTSSTLKIGIKKKNEVKWIDSINYEVSKLPEPDIALGLNTSGYLSGEEIAAADSIYLFINQRHPLNYLKPFVKGFTLAIAKDSGHSYFETHTGGIFSKSAKNKLRNLKPGDLIVIANIDYSINGRSYMINGKII